MQGQPKIVWPASFSLAKAYVDQLERKKCLSSSRISAVRQSISQAEGLSGAARNAELTKIASSLDADRGSSCDAPKIGMLQKSLRDLTGQVVP